MKNTLAILTANILAVTLAIGAIILAIEGVNGWGWLVFAAIVVADGFKDRQ